MPSEQSNTIGDPNAELTIIVPVFNEHENFPRVVEQVALHAASPFRLVMVYDFDEDTTVPVAKALQADRPWLELHKNELGRGVVRAIKAGFQQAKSGPLLVVMGDLSDDLSILPTMMELFRNGNRIVCPSRYMPGGRQIGGPWLKGRLSWLAGRILWWCGFPTRDATNSFRLYDAALIHEVGVESTGGFEIALELTAKAYRRGEKIVETPTTWRDREAGASNFQLRKWAPKYLYWFCYALGLVGSRESKPKTSQVAS